MSRREFIKIGAAAAIGVGVASAIEIPLLEQQIDNKNTEVQGIESQMQQVYLTLGLNEQKALEAIVETIIPTDQNGPGAKEAGVIFFIDHQLAGEYGNNARMYNRGPFVLSGQSGPLTVDGISYPEGSQTVPYPGPSYQYNMRLREFWRYGLEATETYSNQTYGSNFESLSNDQKTQILTDFYNNKPKEFNNIVPKDFFNELIFMTYSGFLMDPMYGGNVDKAGWKLTAFTGANMMDSFNEGKNVTELMVADKPTRFPSHSLGEFQKTLKLSGEN